MIQQGRVCIEETAEALKIAIPIRKHFGLILLSFLWLSLWIMGGCFALRDFINTDGPESLFMLLWLLVWPVGLAYMGTFLSWHLIGEEQVVITDNELRLALNLPWFTWTRRHRPDWIREVGVNTERTPWMDPLLNMEVWGVLGKSLRFRYGYSYVRFGVRLDDAEKALVVDTINTRLGLEGS